MAVSKRLRYEILRRDQHKCRYCGATASDAKLAIDHVTPVTLGGRAEPAARSGPRPRRRGRGPDRDEPSNLVTACVDCNAGKSSSHVGAPYVEDVNEDAFFRSVAMWEAAQVQESEEEALNWHRKAALIRRSRKFTEERRQLAAEAIQAWSEAWIKATGGESPEERARDFFVNELKDYVLAECPRDLLLDAARVTGAAQELFISFPCEGLFDEKDEEVTV